jgi:hypothetical protein
MSSQSFGRVDADGNVYCTDDGVERHVGQYADVSAEEAMAFYVRKFDDINTTLSLFERRVASDAAHSDLAASLAKISEQVTEGIGVGDFAALRLRIATLNSTIEKKVEESLINILFCASPKVSGISVSCLEMDTSPSNKIKTLSPLSPSRIIAVPYS